MPRPQRGASDLVRHAVWCQFPEVRTAAADELKKRPMYNYVPILLGGLRPPLEVAIEYPYGTPEYVRRTIRIKGRDQDLIYVHHHVFVDNTLTLWQGIPWRLTPHVHPGPQPGKREEKDTPKTQLNERIQTVLCQVTGESYREPSEWWDWWRRYNEYESPGERPTRVYTTRDETWRTKREYSNDQSSYERNGFPAEYRSSDPRKLRLLDHMYTMAFSCLAWGTPVWTQTGPVPVEKVQAGDRLLSQDADTGEVTYKVVTQTTARRLGSMRRICFENESITATAGHPFWVVGEGWRMAKELHPGSRVHAVTGSRTVERIEELPEDPAYNLVVEDFHTYFAGPGQVLVHDNTFPQPTAALVPGLLGE